MTCENKVPRPEHPKPQFEREAWLNLNGTWTFCFDFGKSGMDAGRELYKSQGFGQNITVPFCPESKLSGVQHTDFIEAMWYHRKISVPEQWQGKCVLLHFGAVDYEAEVFIDGVAAGTHYGGTVSFRFDITDLVQPGSAHDLVVRVKDELRSAAQPGGKQCKEFQSRRCDYTRTTGIWQTVWLEAVHPLGLEDCEIRPDFDRDRFVVVPRYLGVERGASIRVRVRDGAREVAGTEAPAVQGAPLEIAVPDAKPWAPENPFLYDFSLEILSPDGLVVDSVKSYAGLRKIHIEGNRLFLNNKPLYLRLVLDQGFYPDGIWTAPGDAALKRDIELALAAGFNGARLHQKVFEERFHYWADRLGYLTWAEASSWGGMPAKLEYSYNFLCEWQEIVVRDRNHPSIIAWTPFNETRSVADPALHRRTITSLYELTRALDPTRPVNDSSGHCHVKTDLWTVHTYEQDPDQLRQQLAVDPAGQVWRNLPDHEVDYTGQPYLVDEYGGIKWNSAETGRSRQSWGYGNTPTSLEEFYSRLQGQTWALLDLEHISGYCYTQLTDVEQEQNGIYNYDRSEKFDIQKIAKIFRKEPDWKQNP